MRVSANDGLLMMHDETVGRTTNGRGRVDGTTAREVHAHRLDGGRQVPYLWQVLSLARQTDRVALIELKRMGTWVSHTRLATLIERFGVQRVVVQSWAVVRRLDRIRRLVPLSAPRSRPVGGCHPNRSGRPEGSWSTRPPSPTPGSAPSVGSPSTWGPSTTPACTPRHGHHEQTPEVHRLARPGFCRQRSS